MGLKKLFIAPLLLLVVACAGADPETTRQRYVVMEFAIEGAGNTGTRAIQRGIMEPRSEEAAAYAEGLDTAGAALDEANLQLKMGEFDDALQYLQVGNAALTGIRPLVNRVLGEE
jgi:hypothetical protein